MYSGQLHSTTALNPSAFRLDDSYYLDPIPYSLCAQAHSQSTPSGVYFCSPYDPTSFNAAVAAATAYQHGYPSHYQHNTATGDSFDMVDRRISSAAVQPSRKRKLQDETSKLQYESESCRVCSDGSSGYHFGVFTCEACKGFFRRYSKKSTVLEPCPTRCSINKSNRNNCAACRFDKCKHVGMALDKVRFGKPPKIFRSSAYTPGVKLEPNHQDFQLMLNLLECYQSFDEYEQQPTTTTPSSIIFQFCHRLADIVMPETERALETFRARLKRHESALKFLITGENDQNASSWSEEPQAWVFAHNERWRLVMILLILAFDEDRLGADETVIERILRLFELECDQEQEARRTTEGSNSYMEKNMKCMKAQFVLRFVDMMTNDMRSNRDPPTYFEHTF